MKPYLYKNCKLYYFNRVTLKFCVIDPKFVKAEKIENQIHYSLIENHNPKILICQALNFKLAAAKFLTMIKHSG